MPRTHWTLVLLGLTIPIPCLAETINYTGSVVIYTVQVTGNYQIIAAGAQGGAGASGTGGYGAKVGGNFFLNQNDTLKILVGSPGANGIVGSGGGATFVIDATNTPNTPLIIAGAGGGAGVAELANVGPLPGMDGVAFANGNGTVVGNTTNGGINGDGGGAGPGADPGGAGGSGYLTDGANGGGNAIGGAIFPDINTGGQGITAGGGGGGYSGGGGGGLAHAGGGPGGGGGSYNGSTQSIVATSGANAGYGYVTIVQIDPPPTPTPMTVANATSQLAAAMKGRPK